jgi:3-methyladenine DNA glycosylase AlkD
VDVEALIGHFRSSQRGTAALRAERTAVSKELAGAARGDVLALAQELIGAKVPRFVAYELVLKHPPTMERLTVAEIERLGEGISSWGDVDAFGCIIAGPSWRAGRISDRVIERWARSTDWCWRRAALVSSVPLNSGARGGGGDAPRTLKVCTMLAGDRHDMVQKALSWALRHSPNVTRQAWRRSLRSFEER